MIGGEEGRSNRSRRKHGTLVNHHVQEENMVILLITNRVLFFACNGIMTTPLHRSHLVVSVLCAQSKKSKARDGTIMKREIKGEQLRDLKKQMSRQAIFERTSHSWTMNEIQIGTK